MVNDLACYLKNQCDKYKLKTTDVIASTALAMFNFTSVMNLGWVSIFKGEKLVTFNNLVLQLNMLSVPHDEFKKVKIKGAPIC